MQMRINSKEINTKDAVTHAIVIIRTKKKHSAKTTKVENMYQTLFPFKNRMIASSLHIFKWFTLICGTQDNIE